MTATEVFRYSQHQEIYDPIRGSTYEDAPRNYMIDYATAQGETIMELVGLAPGKKTGAGQEEDIRLPVSGGELLLVKLECRDHAPGEPAVQLTLNRPVKPRRGSRTLLL